MRKSQARHLARTVVALGALALAAGIAGVATPAGTNPPLWAAMSAFREDHGAPTVATDARVGAVVEARRRGVARMAEVARTVGLDVDANSVEVVVEGPTADVQAAVRRAGGTVEVAAPGLVDALVPLGSVARLAGDAAVHGVRAPMSHRALAIAGEEIAVTRAAQNAHGDGITGAGVKIAIVDLGFAGYAARQAQGDLPLPLTTQDYCSGNLTTETDHGTAVAEVVHDMAPGADLTLICVDSEVGLAQAELYAEAQGITIVTHSVAWFATSSGDGSGEAGTPDAIALRAREHGILWVNASGNEARSHWSGPATDSQGDGLVDIAGSGASQRISFDVNPGGTACVEMKWSEWPATTQDLDLYLVRTADQTILAGSVADQAAGPGRPVESLCWQNAPVGLAAVEVAIVRYEMTTSPIIDVYVSGTAGPPNPRTAEHSVVEPASSQATIAVGASCYTQGTREIEAYSSRDLDGDTLGAKPEILGLDGISTGTYGAAAGCAGGTGFLGTSAAAPGVAGALALIAEREPTLSASALEAALLSQAQPMEPENSGPSLAGSGNGRLFVGANLSLPGDLYFARTTQFTNKRVGMRMSASGADQTPATGFDDGVASVSVFPTGDRLAWVAGPENGESRLYVGGTDFSNAVPLTSPGFNDLTPAVSPDGQKIAFMSNRSLYFGVWIVNADGTGLRQVGLTGSHSGLPAWSPDGSKIVYQNSSQTNIRIVGADGSNDHRLTSTVDVSELAPQWHPDGQHILYTRNTGGGEERRLIEIDGSNDVAAPLNLTGVWSPDWSRLAFIGQDRQVRVINADGTNERVLTAVPAVTALWAWNGVVKAPEVIRLPWIEGGLSVGSPAKVRGGTWGSGPVRLSFQWLRCDATGASCVDIVGATSSVRQMTADDAGHVLRARVVARRGATSTTVQSTGTPVVRNVPRIIAVPQLSGAAVVGSALTTSNGSWAGTVSLSYGWRRCDADGSACAWIAGEQSPSYVIRAGDAGARIRAVVTASSPTASTPAGTSPSAAVTATATPPAPQSGGSSGGGDGGGGGGSGGNLPDLQVIQSADRTTAAVGDSVLLRLEASMKNPTQSSGASNLVLTDVLPANVDLVSARTTRGSCVSGRTVTCNLSAINGLLVAQVEIVVKVTGAGEIVNTATLRADETDPDMTNNTATVRLNAPVVTPTPSPTPRPTPSPTPAPKPRPLSLKGTAKADTLRGGGLADVLNGGAGADRLFGLGGPDRLIGGPGKDVVDGGPGNDTLLVRDREKDTVRCGAGRDTVTADKLDVVARDCEVVKRA